MSSWSFAVWCETVQRPKERTLIGPAESTHRTQSRARVTQALDRVRKAARQTLHLAHGTEHSEHSGTAAARRGRPMSDAELDTKVRELATYGAPFVEATGLIAAVRGIEDEAA